MRRVVLLTLAATATAGGCIYSSNVERQLPKPPERFGSAAPGAAAGNQAPQVGRWWEVFQDPQLERLMRQAFAGSLDLQVARAKLDQAHASLLLSKAGYYPRLSAKLDGGRSHTSFKSKQVDQEALKRGEFVYEDVTFDRDTNTLQLSLAASYEIDLWGKVRYAAKAARQELLATEEDLRAAYITLAAQLTESYFLAAELRAQLALLERTIDARQRHVALVKRRYAEGVVTALDLYQAQGNLSGAEARRALFNRQLAAAEHAIAVLVGREPGARGVAGKLDTLPQQVVQLPPGLPAQLLLRRPDLRAAQRRLEAADASVGAAVAGHYPAVTLSASVGYAFDPLGVFWSLLGSITAPLFEGRRIEANVDLKQAQLKLALVSYKATLLKALKEVEDALVSGRELKERVRWLEASVTAAEGALRLSIQQYEQGLITFLPVLTAEQSVYNARSELLTARRELVSARVQLARALGGGWMDAEIKRTRGGGDRS